MSVKCQSHVHLTFEKQKLKSNEDIREQIVVKSLRLKRINVLGKKQEHRTL
jgi:hypothetical protein